MNHRVKISPLVVPHSKKRGSYRKRPYGGNSSLSSNQSFSTVTNRFPQPGGNQITEAPEVIFDPTLGDESVETPPPPMTP